MYNIYIKRPEQTSYNVKRKKKCRIKIKANNVKVYTRNFKKSIMEMKKNYFLF